MKQLDLTLDPCRSRHRGNRQSIAAHSRTRPHKATILRAIIGHLAQCGSYGATCYEIEIALGLSHQTASARCAELKKAGAVTCSGARPTESGASASVLVLNHNLQVNI